MQLDARLHTRGEDGIGVGAAIALQNLFENLCMLVTMSAYTAMTYAAIPFNAITVSLGLLVALSLGARSVGWPRKA